jgi:hypothetical protein
MTDANRHYCVTPVSDGGWFGAKQKFLPFGRCVYAQYLIPQYPERGIG